MEIWRRERREESEGQTGRKALWFWLGLFFFFFFSLFLSDVEGKGGEGSGNEGKREKLIIF
jgi:hypothetical protein